MNSLNTPEAWLNTDIATQQTAPADLDDATEVSRTLHQPALYSAAGALRDADARLAELDALDRSAQAWERWIVRGFVVVLACFGVAHYWPELARWLP